MKRYKHICYAPEDVHKHKISNCFYTFIQSNCIYQIFSHINRTFFFISDLVIGMNKIPKVLAEKKLK